MVAVYPRIVKVYLQKFTGKYVKLSRFPQHYLPVDFY